MAETYAPTKGMIDEAKRALEWMADGKAGQGFTDTGRKRASDIAAGRALSADTVKRMYSFFARHEGDKKATGFNAGEDGFPSAGRVAWSAWGGDAGFSWATKIRNQLLDGDKMSNADIDTAVYAAILKMDEQPDGTLMVHGKATDDTLDSDEQVCDPAWLASAMPEWFKYGNIREQHGATAAGVATEYKAEGAEHFITAHVVDAGSVAKVKAGVLKGFSIGIRRPRIAKDNKALGGRIVDGQIVEISLVDRPANPACTLTMAKTINSELVQVEELEETIEQVEVPVETESVEEVKATDWVELAKTYATDLNKFDQTAFDQARIALATLIQVEAGEMGEGSDEIDSLACLLGAVHALFNWYRGEVAEGEVEGGLLDTVGEMAHGIELADEPEVVKDDSIEMCDKCDKEMKECKCAEGGYSAEEKAASIAAEQEAHKQELRDMIIDVVKSLLPSTDGEVAVTKSLDAERIETLESELEQVKALAAPSGVKRMAATSSANKVDANVLKAHEYRAKASATTDRTLAQGYLDLARELETKTN